MDCVLRQASLIAAFFTDQGHRFNRQKEPGMLQRGILDQDLITLSAGGLRMHCQGPHFQDYLQGASGRGILLLFEFCQDLGDNLLH
jgi:hypothetical protein